MELGLKSHVRCPEETPWQLDMNSSWPSPSIKMRILRIDKKRDAKLQLIDLLYFLLSTIWNQCWIHLVFSWLWYGGWNFQLGGKIIDFNIHSKSWKDLQYWQGLIEQNNFCAVSGFSACWHWTRNRYCTEIWRT